MKGLRWAFRLYPFCIYFILMLLFCLYILFFFHRIIPVIKLLLLAYSYLLLCLDRRKGRIIRAKIFGLHLGLLHLSIPFKLIYPMHPLLCIPTLNCMQCLAMIMIVISINYRSITTYNAYFVKTDTVLIPTKNN